MARVHGPSNRPNEGTGDPTSGVVFSPDARRQLLKLRAFDQRRLVSEKHRNKLIVEGEEFPI